MQGLPSFDDPNLLIGAEHFSDAGVYRLRDDLLIVQSVDFFPPLVDDPYVFGQIAAANSLGDVYAMGGRPTTALNIVGFPDDQLEMSVLAEILRGGSEKVREAGAVVAGGHTVRDTEIKYGLAVTGVVSPEQLLTNQKAQPGDLLVLTKALGTGFVTTAFKAGRCPPEALLAACDSMRQLNAIGRDGALDALPASRRSGVGSVDRGGRGGSSPGRDLGGRPGDDGGGVHRPRGGAGLRSRSPRDRPGGWPAIGVLCPLHRRGRSRGAAPGRAGILDRAVGTVAGMKSQLVHRGLRPRKLTLFQRARKFITGRPMAKSTTAQRIAAGG